MASVCDSTEEINSGLIDSNQDMDIHIDIEAVFLIKIGQDGHAMS